jgi:hypothetical protein
MPAAANTPALTHLSHEEIARLAYSYWQACGCQDGSSEQDWLRAERDLLELAQNR